MGGRLERGLKLLDQETVDELLAQIDDRFTADEILEILCVTTDDVFDKFYDRILKVNWSEFL